MPVTILEAHVAPEHEPALLDAYREAARGPHPPGLVRSTLARNTKDPTLWRIETVWESAAALMAMRSSGTPPRGILIFRAAGAEPTLEILEVVESVTP